MLSPGLVSITFRKINVAGIIALCQQHQLRSIEWGADVHCPWQDATVAQQVGEQTRDAGLAISAYGSYYRLLKSAEEGMTFPLVLSAAQALGAPCVRVWAGMQGSATATAEYRAALVAEARTIASQAQAVGIKVAFEYHDRTLTDTNDSARQLLTEIDHPNMRVFWQPHNGKDADYNCTGLTNVLPWVESVHCFHWYPESQRLPLSAGQERWIRYLKILRPSGRDYPVCLEFVAGDTVEQLAADAATLHQWLGA
ncbi:MAG: TIM barrel protein [Phycisphaerae bacterium]